MPRFRPYVPGSLLTVWYKRFEAADKTWTMWTIWFAYYMHANRLYSVFSNLGVYSGNNQTSLAVHRFEVGLHVSKKKKYRLDTNINITLLNEWKREYVVFPTNPVRLNLDGSWVQINRMY